VTDEEAIRNLHAQFAQHLDDRELESWWMLFVEDGSFNQRVGRDEVRDMILAGELNTIPELRRKHAIGNIIIEVGGDTATSKSDLCMFDRRGADAPWTLAGVGRYEDRLVKVDGKWYFKHRELHLV
jgi:3-phenylpropionate/cinnamic acid dioxygenase small subunit